MEFVNMSREEQLAALAALKQEYAEAQAKKLFHKETSLRFL